MLTGLLSLLGGGLGGLLRFVPLIVKFFEDGKDRDHEFRMSELQLRIDEARSKQALDLAHAQSDAQQAVGEMQAYIEALKGQGQLTGVKWIDALNASVRPVVTYWWMLLLSGYKLVVVIGASIELYITIKAIHSLTDFGPALEAFAGRVWTVEDAGILSMILGFWFVDRAVRHQQGR